MITLDEKALDMAMDSYCDRMNLKGKADRKKFKKDCRQDFIDTVTDYLAALKTVSTQ